MIPLVAHSCSLAPVACLGLMLALAPVQPSGASALASATVATAPSPSTPEPPALSVPGMDAPESAYVELATKLVPLIEEAAGAKFAKPVAVKFTSPIPLGELIAPSIKEDLREKEPGTSDMALHFRSMAPALKIAEKVLGVYRYQDQTVYLIPKNAEQFVIREVWDVPTRDRVIVLSLVHELAHALQDQQVGLKRITDAAAAGEARASLTAVIEGHAAWITSRVAQRLGFSKADAALMDLVAPKHESTYDHASDSTGRTVTVDPPSFAYRFGSAFIAFHADKAGNSAGPNVAWSILRTPPTKVSQIREPGTFTPVTAPPPASPEPGSKAPPAPGR